jgi:hypothetical protein
MPTKKSERQPQGALVPSAMTELATLPGAMLMRGGTVSEEEAEIIKKALTDMARQRAFGAKYRYGLAVMEQGAQAAQASTVRFLEQDQALRSRLQDPAVQAKLDSSLERIALEHENAVVVAQQVLYERVIEVMAAPVDPPPGQERVIVTKKLGLLGKLFGGEEETRVIR